MTIDNKMIGKYVIVRCSQAGVHAGRLEAVEGSHCVLTNSRRLWYWKPKKGKFLSAVANNGLHSDSNIGETNQRIHLSEFCEITLCTQEAEKSITGMAANEN